MLRRIKYKLFIYFLYYIGATELKNHHKELSMPLFDTYSSQTRSRAEQLAGEPGAAYWARVCAWVPGTGHCRNRDCSEACIFGPQRKAELRRVQRWRRLRRVFAICAGRR